LAREPITLVRFSPAAWRAGGRVSLQQKESRMTRNLALVTVLVLTGLAATGLFLGCTTSPVESTDGDGATPSNGDATVPGVLQIKAFTDSLGAAARVITSGQDAPDDVDVNLTPTEYTVAFKRIVLKEVDEESEETLAEVEVFDADTVDEALVIDLLNSTASDVLDVEELSGGTYNQVDIEVFYLDMTVATLYPGTTSYDIAYRMVFEEMGVLEPRDFLLYLEPAWMEDAPELAASVTEAGWYWMEMADPDHVVAVDGAAAHPEFHVLDLFANDEFWSSEHKVLEGGRISPPLEYDPNDGGVLTIEFDVTGKFNFKDYYDENTDPDGLWEIRRDAGIHPFPPDFECAPEILGTSATPL
jgi:hypothetical protein